MTAEQPPVRAFDPGVLVAIVKGEPLDFIACSRGTLRSPLGISWLSRRAIPSDRSDQEYFVTNVFQTAMARQLPESQEELGGHDFWTDFVEKSGLVTNPRPSPTAEAEVEEEDPELEADIDAFYRDLYAQRETLTEHGF